MLGSVEIATMMEQSNYRGVTETIVEQLKPGSSNQTNLKFFADR